LGDPLDLSHFDVIHAMTPETGWVAALLRQDRPRLAVQIDSTIALHVRDFGHSRFATTPARRVEQSVLRAADLVLCWSDWAARSAVADYGVDPARTRVFPVSIVAREQAPPHPGPARVIFVGKDWVRKGGPMLLRVHQRSLADRVELHVVSRRAPPDRSARNVVWHGQVDNRRLVDEVLPSMDLIAMPTREDCWSVAILEAATWGVPAVTTRVGGIPELVLDGQTGLLTDRGDEAALARALDQMTADPELRRSMGRAALERARQHYDPDRNYGMLLDSLVELAGS
jgi:glycosyltransferase involved in cell wall biosynthesis